VGGGSSRLGHANVNCPVDDVDEAGRRTSRGVRRDRLADDESSHDAQHRELSIPGLRATLPEILVNLEWPRAKLVMCDGRHYHALA